MVGRRTFFLNLRQIQVFASFHSHLKFWKHWRPFTRQVQSGLKVS